MADSLNLTADIGKPPTALYRAWLSSKEHGLMTGASAEIDARVGGKHSAWDGYISGETVELEPGRRIVQSWRTSDFPAKAADSHLEVHFDAIDGGTRLRIVHTKIPKGQGKQYDVGWREFYFQPMLARYGAPKKAKPTKPAKPKKAK